MTLDQIKELIEFIREHDLSEFELEQDGVKIRVKTGSAVAPPPAQYGTAPQPALAPAASAGPPPSTASPLSSAASPGVDEGSELAIVKSPIVGTFYRSPEPGAPAFVDVGATVRKGQVLCIIEAMKLMNEIDSEYDGEVVSAYVENGQAVQYGERLFAIRLKA